MKYPEKVVIGLMSGTSLDGLDIAACLFSGEGASQRFQLLRAETIEYDARLKKKLSGLMSASALEYAQMDFDFGYYMGDQVAVFLDRHSLRADLVASHGHTIFHQPHLGFTSQIGHGACISARCRLPVIYDFRSLDVALGGQGAPLVPIGDKLLFGDFTYCLNLGGIANISFDDSRGNRVAFDICPVNMVLNELASKLNKEYDKNGDIAASGKLSPDLLDQLEILDFYHQSGPKSLGREWVEKNIFPLLDRYPIPVSDKLHTFCAHIARRVAAVLPVKNGKEKKILITGGGAFNTFLINVFRKTFSRKIAVHIPDRDIIAYKEAIVFAFLGYLRAIEVPNCLASVTGASRDSLGGLLVNP